MRLAFCLLMTIMTAACTSTHQPPETVLQPRVEQHIHVSEVSTSVAPAAPVVEMCEQFSSSMAMAERKTGNLMRIHAL